MNSMNEQETQTEWLKEKKIRRAHQFIKTIIYINSIYQIVKRTKQTTHTNYFSLLALHAKSLNLNRITISNQRSLLPKTKKSLAWAMEQSFALFLSPFVCKFLNPGIWQKCAKYTYNHPHSFHFRGVSP